MGPDAFAFVTALLVNFVDTMGLHFSFPVLFPYGRWMGAGVQTIALFSTVRGIAAMVSNFWMPRLSDRRGRKLVIMLSLLGSAIAYLVQGLAGEFVGASVMLFFIGRALSGFFGGTTPVVRAYVAEISMPDVNLLKQRMTILMVSNQAAGIALSPIAGALATFGLSLPFYVCAGVGMFGLFWALCFFQEASQLRVGTTDTSQSGAQCTSKSNDAASKKAGACEKGEADSKERPKRRNPWCDKVVIFVFISYICVFMLIAGFVILIPQMLEDASFGLVGSNQVETSGNISKAFGLIAVPQGVCNILTSLVFFVPVTRKFGDIKTIVVAGTVATLNFVVYGWSNKLWHLCVNQAITGVCFGFMVPALGPLMARYASTHYPSQAAECQGIPILGMNLSMAFGQNILALMYTQFGMKVAWSVCAASCGIFVILFAVSCQIVEARNPKPDLLTAEQKKVALKIGGEDVDKFIDAVCEELRHILAENKEKLWNRPMQFLVRQRLNGTVPEIREWDDQSQGHAYLEDLGSLLRSFPEEYSSFISKFPQVESFRRTSSYDPVDIDVVGGAAAFQIPSRSPSSENLSKGDASPRNQIPDCTIDV